MDSDKINQEIEKNPKIVKRVLVFDLDDCLYPASGGVERIFGRNVQNYLIDFMEKRRSQQLPIPEEIVNLDGQSTQAEIQESYGKLYKRLVNCYGTSINGLIGLGYFPKNDDNFLLDYTKKVCDIEVEEVNLTHNDADLINAFEMLKKKHNSQNPEDEENFGLIVLFSNSDKVHTKRFLDHLGISRFFDIWVNFEDFKTSNKPNDFAYKTVEKKCQEFVEKMGKTWKIDPKITEFVFFDDNLQNVKKAVDLGWKGVLVKETLISDDKMPIFEKKYENELIPELEIAGKGGQIRMIRNVSEIPRKMKEYC